VQERLAGMRVVQLFGRERARRRFAALNDGHLDAHLRSIRVYALYFPVIEFLTTLALASLLVTAAATEVSGRGDHGGHRGGVPAARAALLPAAAGSLGEVQHPAGGDGGSERMFELLDTPAAEGVAPTADREAGGPLRPAGVTVTFEDVWFAYDRSRDVDP
jgi:ATP-binding cassette, subfamily B, multidrug efflux pump